MILKDVAYVDLIAIVNFMYHGEVMVSEEQLPSFLQTATILQVSGLINNENTYTVNRQTTLKKAKLTQSEPHECPKKIKLTPKQIKSTEETSHKRVIHQTELIETDNIKIENTDELEEVSDQNIFKSSELQEKNENQTQSSILEAALEVKTGSILERSLTSQPTSGKSPSVPLTCEKLNILQVLPDISIPKTVFIPRKPPENELERLILRSSSESSSSPSAFDRPSEFLHQSIKVESADHHEMEVR